ncbi:MAG: YdcF family protein [Betaproteobacteria bacterium]|nr:MAG: YdcF family protein [Betaproteobacteria bacterium]
MPFDPSLVLFWLKKLVALAVLPPLMPPLVVAAGLLLLRRRRRAGMLVAWFGIVLQFLLVFPPAVGLLLAPLESSPVLTAEAARDAGAIVILGAGKRDHAPEFGGETVNRLALERLRYGARLARETGLPVLVSGGAPTGELPEAVLMKQCLVEDFGITPRWIETESRDTRDNARLSALQLKAAGVHRVLLVTHAAHMPRALAEFEAQGLGVVPAPTAWLGSHESKDRRLALLPSQNTAYAGWYAVHEWLGLLAYRLSR